MADELVTRELALMQRQFEAYLQAIQDRLLVLDNLEARVNGLEQPTT